MPTSETVDAVDALLSLQEVDEEIDLRRERLESLEPELSDRRQRVEELESEVRELRSDVEEAESELRQRERTVKAARETVKRLREKADDVQSMKQHKAVRKEIISAEENLDSSEDDVLDAMQQVETLRSRLSDAEEELEETREDYEAAEADVATSRDELKEELRDWKEKKRVLEEQVEDRLLDAYRKIRSGTTDSALAPLTPDGVCGHCFTFVPPQRRSEIRSGEKLHTCEGCGVILYPPSREEDEDDDG